MVVKKLYMKFQEYGSSLVLSSERLEHNKYEKSNLENIIEIFISISFLTEL